MVSSLKMPENTGTPESTGQPVPVRGLHSGEEYLRVPTKVMGTGLPPAVTIQAPVGLTVIGHGTFCPLGPPGA